MAGRKGKGSRLGKSVKSAGRQERLAAALRENLKRRKAKDRAMGGDGTEGSEQPSQISSRARPKKTSEND
jgi:hypothetical protein